MIPDRCGGCAAPVFHLRKAKGEESRAIDAEPSTLGTFAVDLENRTYWRHEGRVRRRPAFKPYLHTAHWCSR